MQEVIGGSVTLASGAEMPKIGLECFALAQAVRRGMPCRARQRQPKYPCGNDA